MSLEIDIKSNDAFAKSAYEAADALDKVAAKEKEVDALSQKIGASYKQAADAAGALSKNTASASAGGAASSAKPKDKKASSQADKQQAAAAKKRTEEAKKQKEENKKSLEAMKLFGGVLAGAAVGAAALGTAIAFAAKSAFDAKRESAALIDAFTGKRGPEHLKLLDTLATNLGASFADVRGKFVEFRQAGLDNKLSFKLIKMRADLMAVGLSAGAADKEVARVTSAADGRGNVAAYRALAEISRAYRGIGDGAKAAAFAATSLEGAQNKISNHVGEELSKLWGDIAPDIGKAAHALADFALDLLKSEDGKAMIQGIADGFKAVAGVVTGENLTTGLNVIKALGVAIFTVFDVAGKSIAYAAVKGVEALDWLTEKFGNLVEGAIDLFPAGAAIVDGLIDGITSGVTKAIAAAADLAKSVAGGFADVLGIKSPSKLFAEYGKNTVAGYEKGERAAIGSMAMPLQEAAAEPIKQPQADRSPALRGSTQAGGGGGITIENLIVQGGGDPEEIARSIRQQLQLLLQAGSLSRGLT